MKFSQACQTLTLFKKICSFGSLNTKKASNLSFFNDHVLFLQTWALFWSMGKYKYMICWLVRNVILYILSSSQNCDVHCVFNTSFSIKSQYTNISRYWEVCLCSSSIEKHVAFDRKHKKTKQDNTGRPRDSSLGPPLARPGGFEPRTLSPRWENYQFLW